jgi:hypothetical protein
MRLFRLSETNFGLALDALAHCSAPIDSRIFRWCSSNSRDSHAEALVPDEFGAHRSLRRLVSATTTSATEEAASWFSRATGSAMTRAARFDRGPLEGCAGEGGQMGGGGDSDRYRRTRRDAKPVLRRGASNSQRSRFESRRGERFAN